MTASSFPDIVGIEFHDNCGAGILTVCDATAANGSAEAASYGWRSRRASLSHRVGRETPTHDIPLA